MPLGMATALFQSSVIFITLLAPIFLGEKVGIYRWTAVITGLAGVVIITDPFAGVMSWYALYGIGAALVGAGQPRQVQHQCHKAHTMTSRPQRGR